MSWIDGPPDTRRQGTAARFGQRVGTVTSPASMVKQPGIHRPRRRWTLRPRLTGPIAATTLACRKHHTHQPRPFAVGVVRPRARSSALLA